MADTPDTAALLKIATDLDTALDDLAIQVAATEELSDSLLDALGAPEVEPDDTPADNTPAPAPQPAAMAPAPTPAPAPAPMRIHA